MSYLIFCICLVFLASSLTGKVSIYSLFHIGRGEFGKRRRYKRDMENRYINTLIQHLMHIEIWSNLSDGKSEPGSLINPQKFKDYTLGMKALVNTFTECKKHRGQVFFIGNGGSSAIASHMTADFMKNGGMNTYSLYDNSVTTCMGNDYGYEYIFSKPMEFLVRPGDLVVAISSSGNSKNILYALEVAKKKKATTITFTGFQEDNPAKQMGNLNVYVPCRQYGIVESIHNLVLQQIVDEIMERDGVKI